MGERILCPYYGKGETYCEVGCRYISSTDVRVIVLYCTGSFESCLKYQELCERRPLTELRACAGA